MKIPTYLIIRANHSSINKIKCRPDALDLFDEFKSILIQMYTLEKTVTLSYCYHTLFVRLIKHAFQAQNLCFFTLSFLRSGGLYNFFSKIKDFHLFQRVNLEINTHHK